MNKCFIPEKYLPGTVAIVTGGFSGIGLALATEAVKFKCKGVALLDVEKSAASNAIQHLSNVDSNVQILTVNCDVTSPDSVNESLSKVKAMWPSTPIGLLCCNAGVVAQPKRGGSGLGGSTGMLDSTLEDWNFTFGVNVYGVINTLKTYGPVMLQQERVHSCIVNTSSVAGITTASMGPYSVSKHACAAITEGLYMEMKNSGADEYISVHCLCPAVIATKIFHAERNRPDELVSDLDKSSKENKVATAMKLATQEMYAEEGLSPQATAEAAFNQISQGFLWLLVDNPPPMQLDIKSSVGRRMGGILTQWGPAEQPKGAPPTHMQMQLAKRTEEILSKM